MKSERTGRPTSAAAMVAAAASLEKARTRLEKTLTTLGRAADRVAFQRRAPAAVVCFEKAMPLPPTNEQRPASAAWVHDAVNTSVPPLNPEPSREPPPSPRLLLDQLIARTAREQGLPPSAATNVALQTAEGRALVARITGATK